VQGMGGAVSWCSQAFCSVCFETHKSTVQKPVELDGLEASYVIHWPAPPVATKVEFIHPLPPVPASLEVDDEGCSSGSESERVEFEAPQEGTKPNPAVEQGEASMSA